MHHWLKIKKEYFQLGKIQKEKILNLFLFDKKSVSLNIFFFAMVFIFLHSMHISFMWPLELIGPVFVSVLLLTSMLISNSSPQRIFTRLDFVPAIALCIAVILYGNVIHSKNIVGILFSVFNIFIFFSLFRLDKSLHSRLATVLCKSLACLLILSMTGFVMYLLGFSFPSKSAEWGDYYYYTDYYLFLLDDRSLYNLIPRFHSIFLEPGHMGTVIVLLLATQIGKWNKWYNITMIIAMLISFSLAAYGLFVILIFLRLWVLRKKIIRSLILSISLVGGVVIGSFFYNDGDNMLNQLIVMRLEVNDTGDDIEGNNRVTETFQREFDSFITSPSVLFGKDKWEEKGKGGNAGYKLYIYENGLVGFILVYTFYSIAMRGYKDKRLFYAMLILSLANFWIRSYPLWYGFFLPYYLMVDQELPSKNNNKKHI